MAAYWKVKSWDFSFSNYSNGGSGSFSVVVGVDEMSDLVCPTSSSGSGTGSDQVFTLSGGVSAFGMQMDVICFDDINFFYDSGISGGSQLVTIIIGDQTIITSGFFPLEVSATVTITAISFF